MSMQKHRGSLVWLIAWLSLGSAVWLASPRSAQNHAKANATSLSAISDKKPSQEDRLSSSGKRLKSIERVEVGQRVATGISQEIRDLAIGDPLAVPQWDRVDHEIDSQTWRKLTLVMHTPQGDRFDITLLRPIGWLESCNAQVGSSIHLVVSEQGLDGLADVLAIEPCPSIFSGVGRVVTGTFTHVRGGILRITLAGLAEPLGVTSNHSIYSSDRLDFVPAGELRVGETLRNLDGDVRIESIEQLGSEERVYNLEIHGEHVFRVASSGLLVHNSSGTQTNAPNRPVHIDIGGEGRYPNAINVNPKTTTSTTGTAGRTIPNRVPGRGESLPFGARHADGISLENAPITAQTAVEIARVIKPGGSIRLVSPSDYAAAAHKRVIDSISGCNVQQSTVNGITTTTITVPR
jgi:hypothetical protein